MRALYRLAGLWLDRKAGNPDATAAARAAVAHLKPIVLVTGGSRGIGAAIAGRFAGAGYDVAIVARDAPALEKSATHLRKTSRATVLTLVQDITVPDAPAELERNLQRRGYYIDVLVNNAGLGLAGPFASHEAKAIASLLDLNIGALTRLTRHALPGMLARRRGGILNVASVGGVVPGPNQAVYYASKAYVLSLTLALAAEYSGQGVRISSLAPGPVDTGFHAAMGAGQSLYRRLLPATTPAAAARTAYSGFMLGRTMIVPGLFSAGLYAFARFLPHFVTIPVVKALLSVPGRP